MMELWSERQRTALRAFRAAVATRARREEEIATGTADRTREADHEFRQTKEKLRSALAQAQSAAQANLGASRQAVESRREEMKDKANAEFAAAKSAAVREYADRKSGLEGE